MKFSKHPAVIVFLASAVLVQPVFGQGSLTPPGAPAPTMKSLAEIEPRTAISSIPYTINTPGSYYLTTNVSASSGYGILIVSSDVTLDLNGFELAGGPATQAGVRVSGSQTNITVRNGVITRWGTHGVDLWSSGYPRNTLLENLKITFNGSDGAIIEAGNVVRDCQFFDNGNYCMENFGGQILRCVARENGYGFLGQNSDFVDCRSERNGGFGFSITRCTMTRCVSEKNGGSGANVMSAGNVLKSCRIFANNYIGINLNGNATISDSVVETNGSYGISIYGNGSQILGNNCVSNANIAIIIQGHANRVLDNNIVSRPGVVGVEVTSSGYSNNIVARNTVTGNGANNFLILGSMNDTGPIGSASTATSPWANISH